jgi:hypothetical protein
LLKARSIWLICDRVCGFVIPELGYAAGCVEISRDNSLATNYVLIDLENVQPRNLELLQKHPFKVFVFCGANQTKLPFDLADAMQLLGENGKYVKISGNGKNALDFHIACYIGELAAKDPGGLFHVISKDTGFDHLIQHLCDRKIKVNRLVDLAEIPELRMSINTSNDEKIATIVKNLEGRGQSRPRKLKTLRNTINSLFTKKLEESELTSLIYELKKLKHIYVAETKVTYTTPA